MIKTVPTPDGLVIRRILAHGEDAWRWSGEGRWTHQTAHDGPWCSVNGINVPREVLRAMVEYQDQRDGAGNG